jgi:hypothetical protein
VSAAPDAAQPHPSGDAAGSRGERTRITTTTISRKASSKNRRPRQVFLLLLLGLAVWQRELLWPPLFHRLARNALESQQPATALGWLAVAESPFCRRGDTALLFARAHRASGETAVASTWIQEARRRGAAETDVERETILLAAQSGQLRLAVPRLPALLTDSALNASRKPWH